MTEQQMNSDPTYQHSSCTPCAACNESNTTTTRKRDVNETKTIADDTARRVPQLRFPEFQNAGEWESASFTDLFSLLPNNTLSRAELSTDGEGIYNIHYGDILIKFPSYVNVQKTTLPCIKEATKISNISKARLKDGDIVIADTAEDETAGKCIEIGNVKNTAVVAGLHTIPCRPNKRFAPAYLGYYMNSHAFHSMLLPIMQGAKVTSISRTALKSVIIYYPSSIEEQQKIADCLLTIDDHIVAITQKLEQLKIQKKALLQKLFPQRGKNIPELRFPEFQNAGEWEEKTLGEVTIVVNKRNRSNRNLPIYSISNKYGFILQAEQFDGLDSNKRGYDTSMYKVVGKNTFAYNPARINVGSIGYSYNLKEIMISSLYVCFKTMEDIDDHFLMCYFNTQNFRQSVDNNVEGGIRSYLFYENFSRIRIQFPTLQEQRQIAAILMSINNLIEKYENKLVLLEDQKKGLLQRLFPSINK